MGIFRSEDMNLIKCVMSKDSAFDIMEAFGELGVADFIDLNKHEQVYDLPFTKQIRRCNDIIRKIDFLIEVCQSHGIEQRSLSSMADFEEAKEALREEFKTSKYAVFDKIEKECEEKESFINDQTKNIKDMWHNYNYLREYWEVLKKVSTFLLNSPNNVRISRFSNCGSDPEDRKKSDDNFFKVDSESSNEEISPEGYQAQNKILNLSYLAGIVERDEVERMKKIVFRASRGNALIHSMPIDIEIKEYLGQSKLKDVYIITFQEGETLRAKLERVCDSFNTDHYQVPNDDIRNKIEHIKDKIKETEYLINTTNNEMRAYLCKVCKLKETYLVNSGISRLMLYKLISEYDKAVYLNLNKLVPKTSLFQGYFWSARGSGEILQKLDHEECYLTEIQFEDCVNNKIPPPTFFRTNAFLDPFQEIVNTYGIPWYKEANPALFTIVTFPFLFGVMFGDIGHGTILLLFGTILCLFSGSLENTALKDMVNVRYLILLLGFFATFWGWIYNDFMSIPVELYDSCYTINSKTTEVALKQDWVYPIGIDPSWYLGKNELTFANSLKMKLSVIFGIAQMSLGIFLKASNAVYFKKKLELYFEFIPQITLLWCIFGYMITLIIVKWLSPYPDSSQAPAIIAYMIEMFLNFGAISGNAIIHSQGINEALHVLLLMVSLICIPTMLCVKPYLLWRDMKKSHREPGEIEMQEFSRAKKNQYHRFEEEEDKQIGIPGQEKEEIAGFGKRAHEQADDFGHQESDALKERLYTSVADIMGEDNHAISEIAIHQLIETIEFVLGTISNTASYLRLWALSLAHSQLAAVFFEKVLEESFVMASPIGLFLLFPLFATATIGVLMWMDAMECFLHTLRLHWVEFQNKFFKGTGYKFKGFSLSDELQMRNN